MRDHKGGDKQQMPGLGERRTDTGVTPNTHTIAGLSRTALGPGFAVGQL